ncbi:hypothetical protein GCM10027062_32540 [Nocardioides hungaricus]
MQLTAEDFPEFFEAVHGHRPFAWQRDLTVEVLRRGAWPDAIDVPTGLGKTTMIDIATFVSAASSATGGTTSPARRRLFFVVDRRLVVDQAHAHAQRLSNAIQDAASEILAEVRSRLIARRSDSDAPALEVTRMRGGVTWDAAWLERPDQSGVVTGTIDQVGSRLFFRGYGTSSRRWPIEAALVGVDALIMVDEAHLATAMVASITTAQGMDGSTSTTGLPPAHVVQLSATQGPTADPPSWTYEIDLDAHNAAREPVAARRLRSPKTATCLESSKASIVKDLAGAAVEAVAAPGARVLVVCNTVDCARQVHLQLSKDTGAGSTFLLIGRSRGVDRDRLSQDILEALLTDPWVISGRGGQACGRRG